MIPEKGLDFLAAYTLGNAMSNASDILSAGNTDGYRAPRFDGFGISHDYRRAMFDIPHLRLQGPL